MKQFYFYVKKYFYLIHQLYIYIYIYIYIMLLNSFNLDVINLIVCELKFKFI